MSDTTTEPADSDDELPEQHPDRTRSRYPDASAATSGWLGG